jgi:hypothetical protein
MMVNLSKRGFKYEVQRPHEDKRCEGFWRIVGLVLAGLRLR